MCPAGGARERVACSDDARPPTSDALVSNLRLTSAFGARDDAKRHVVVTMPNHLDRTQPKPYKRLGALRGRRGCSAIQSVRWRATHAHSIDGAGVVGGRPARFEG